MSGRDLPERVGVLGFGEVGETTARAFADRGATVTVVNRSPDALRERLADDPLDVAEDPAGVARASDLVVSAVWPTSAREVAAAAAPGADGVVYVDLNTVSPPATRAMAAAIEDAGGSFHKGIIRGAVARRGTDVQIPVAGPAGRETVVAALAAVGFDALDAGPDRERVAAFKMYRSMITKGLRQLFAEMLVPASEQGLEGEVLAALADLFEETALDEWVRYATANTPPHARRRVGELDEILDTVADAGYEAPTVARARALHAFVAEREIEPDHDAVVTALRPYLRADGDGDGNGNAETGADGDGA